MDNFEEWLCNQLKALNTDEAVFGSYIKSILEETAEDLDEKIEGLDGILQELGVTDVQLLRNEILLKWNAILPTSDKKLESNSSGQYKPNESTAESHFDDLLRFDPTVEKKPSENTSSFGRKPDEELRAAILSHLSSSSDSEEDQPHTETKHGASSSSSGAKKKGGTSGVVSDVGRNANVEKVLNEQKELKDKAKAEHLKKKERDKEDRSKQKAAAQERKDKTKKKAAKVERKR